MSRVVPDQLPDADAAAWSAWAFCMTLAETFVVMAWLLWSDSQRPGLGYTDEDHAPHSGRCPPGRLRLPSVPPPPTLQRLRVSGRLRILESGRSASARLGQMSRVSVDNAGGRSQSREEVEDI